ncbi:MAG: tetraacyldisaccharide 4'-kinase, partial [Bacteroidales bacterium]|nr:tetraacyldisaccharide 4'-kinase [Bacteroidales bacterium]
TDSLVSEVGDEPLQFKIKFPENLVCVCESRVEGINKIIASHPETNLIILDDGLQHRYVSAGINILLSDYHNLYINDYPVPSGTLREFRSGAKRAEIIVITKTSKVLSPITRNRIINQLRPANHQIICFSYIKHGPLTQIPGHNFEPSKKKYNTILLVTGIANPYPLEVHLRRICDEFETIEFPDHHKYTEVDIERIAGTFNNFFSRNKIIVTTEKDVMRLQDPAIFNLIRDLPVCYIPIEIVIHNEDRENFHSKIQRYVGED